MGYIKEPEGVDFVINGKPLTDKQKKEISEFIKADKKRISEIKTRRTKSTNRQQGIGHYPEKCVNIKI
jgi:hypothetical protein